MHTKATYKLANHLFINWRPFAFIHLSNLDMVSVCMLTQSKWTHLTLKIEASESAQEIHQQVWQCLK